MAKQFSDYTFLIVTPSFNQGQFIAETIDSIVAQTGVPIHYYIADGGSKDETVAVIKNAKQTLKANKDAALTLEWVSESDNGQTDAINKGIRYFQALVEKKQLDPDKTIFAYINSDDYYLPGAFTTVLQAFKQHPPVGWVVGDYAIDTTTNQAFHQLGVRGWKWLLKQIYSASLLKVLNPIAQPATFIRWSAVDQVGLFNEKLNYVMDYEYWLRLQSAVGDPLFIPEVLAGFRIHDASKGGVNYAKQFAEQLDIARQYTENRVLLGLHQLHNWIAVTLYQLTK